MPNCDFYALSADLRQVLDFVFAQPQWRLFESSSLHDSEVREFNSTKQIIEAFQEFRTLRQPMHFQLYSPSMKGRVVMRRITFHPGAVPGATFRFDTEGWGLIQLYFGTLRQKELANCHTNHFSERRAAGWQEVRDTGIDSEAWDFAEVTRMSSRLNRFIKKLAVEKVYSRPVLPAAAEAQRTGRLSLRFP